MATSRRGRLDRSYLHLYCLLWLCFCTCQRDYVQGTYTSGLQHQEAAGESGSKLDINNLLPLETIQEENYKRSSAFFPLRGKKLTLDSLVTSHQNNNPEQDYREDKRSQFFPLRGKKIPDDIKRASYFMPMRGRKEDNSWTPEDYDVTDEIPEKKASSFMPMRGKKGRSMDVFQHLPKTGTYSNEVMYPFDAHNETADKRASYFLPMRGKRSYAESDESSENTSLDGSLGDSSAHTVKKRSVTYMPLQKDSEGDGYDGVEEKRKYAFMPMRGRRDPPETNNSLDEANSLEKKSMSFMPMRGRREDEEFSANLQAADYDIYNKRAQFFMPMRGRSDDLYNQISSPDSYNFDLRDNMDAIPGQSAKRASYFTAMRGRRSGTNSNQLQDSETGDTNKRMGFMPMRGRRSVWSDMEDDPDWKVQEWPAEDLMSLLDKRASSFMAMRGRRESPDNHHDDDKRLSSFMPMRGRRMSSDMMDTSNFYNPYSYFVAGIGSSLISRPPGDKAQPFSYYRNAVDKKRRFKINWDSVKRAFHATRGKRLNEMDDVNSYHENSGTNQQSASLREKRSIVRHRMSMQPQRQYIALKRPMSFFATRGKRFDASANKENFQAP